MKITNKDKPLVAVWSLVYNHEPYLKDYFEGIVMQKTDFPFVAIVHDDASTDGSAAIIREYAEKYPDIIKPIFEKENQYSKGDGTLDRLMREAIEKTGAKYVALCEGDDYWIDPFKLQKQVDFLESNPEYGLVHTGYLTLKYKDKYKIKQSTRSNLDINIPIGNVYKNIIRNNHIATVTVLFKMNLIRYMENEIDPLPYWDRILWICFSRHTLFYYISDITAAYRITNNSATHGDYSKVLKTDIKGTNDLLTYLFNNKISKNDIKTFYVERCSRLLKLCYLSHNKKLLYIYWNIIKSMDKPRLDNKVCWYFGRFEVPKIIYHSLLKIYSIYLKMRCLK